jgi:lysosomal alpha-mannosidase
LIEQWTILLEDPVGGENAIIKVKKSDLLPEFIEFDVEMTAIPIELDYTGKDVTVNWRMYNGFSANKTFWTDSNSLFMVKRDFINYTRPDQYIAGNYYPVTSAIAMRDHQNGSNIQVTVLNDRTQGGSADVATPNTIELMQNRRTINDDGHGLNEALNDRDLTGKGLAVNAKYYMQIFNTKKGQSL